ncbi:hypothetical protein HUR95_00740 [Caldalkalibacillus thermarum TA2.A1]|nr:hypothetical protein [Caldalkalibacillus thermarum]QZT34000.1 hypothetical protein HUR95_00740 [Caldalkalibacillus thermarum TA2.A1]
MIELERQRDGLKGATVIANHAGGRIRELEQENKRYREALEKISDMHRLKHSVTDAIEVAKKALEGGERDD